jgi:hypothetical protein
MPTTELPAETPDTRLNSNLRQLFPAGDIYLVSDDKNLERAAGRYGLRGVALADAAKLPDGASVVLFLRHELVSVEARRLFEDSRVLFVPVASFDPGLQAALYTQRLTMLTDFAAALNLSKYWVNGLSNEQGQLFFDGSEDHGETHLTCKLDGELNTDVWLKPTIEPGEWVGVGTLCEVSLTPPSLTDWGGYTIDGSAVASGVLVAEDARHPQELDYRFAAARRLQRELTTRGPVTLRFEEGILCLVEAGGEDFTAAVLEATNPDYGLHTIELGIGTNLGVLPHVDWRMNSQLNEGAGTVHLGFGEGITGAHIDFVVAECAHSFDAAR